MHGMWDLSSLARDQTHTPCIRRSLFCFLNIFFCLFIYLAVPGCSYNMQTLACGMWDLVPQPDIEPGRPPLGVQSLSHWTTREFPRRWSLNHWTSREIPDIEFLCRKIWRKKNFFNLFFCIWSYFTCSIKWSSLLSVGSLVSASESMES